MLACKKIRQSFSKMILFSGKLGYNPNTLNNRVHTYFLAHQWQQKNMQGNENEQSQYTHQKWLELIESVSKFNIDWKNQVGANPKDAGLSLFYDWSVYGDMMLIPEYEAVAFLDQNQSNPLQSFKQKFPHAPPTLVTKKMGGDKGVMAIIDQDAQDAYKTFSLSLRLGHKYKVRFEPAVSRNLSWRILKDILATDKTHQPYLTNPTSLQTEWWFAGNPQQVIVKDASKQDPSEKEVEQFFQQFVKDKENSTLNRLFLKEVQYRYNHNTKVSQIKGYVSQSKETNQSNDLNMQGWRTVYLPNNIDKNQDLSNPNPNWSGVIHTKKIGPGILIDISSALPENNNPTDFTPIYPNKFVVTLKDKSNSIIYRNQSFSSQDLERINQKYAGMIFIKNQQLNLPLPQDSQILADLHFVDNNGNERQFSGQEKEFMLNFKDACIKSEINENVPLSMSQYTNSAFVEIYCSRYGVPYNGKVKVKLRTIAPVNDASIQAYQSSKISSQNNIIESFKLFITKVQQQKNQEKKKLLIEKYGENGQITIDSIQKKVYDGTDKFNIITNISDNLIQQRTKLNSDKRRVWKRQRNQKETWAGEDFTLQFSNGQTFDQIDFQNGVKKVEVKLDQPLTSLNNPRSPQIPSLAVMGILNQYDEQQNSQIPLNSNKTFFFSIFYNTQNSRDIFNDITMVDWQNSVGPTLKKMGLLYPSMQKIIDLYSFRGMSMKAMKRAFDVEDENHPRYMPSTREMSKLEHRQLRKWLYDPHYRISKKNEDTKTQHKKQLYSGMNSKNVTVQTFNELKSELVSKLKSAFMVELTTIPLYLTAMYTPPDKNSQKLLRSVAIDQMKHLFIASNLLNAISDENTKVPYIDSEYIPSYLNGTLPGVLHTSQQFDPNYKKYFQTFFIQPCTPEQILRFICIELPGETDIKFRTDITNDPELQQRIQNLNGIMKAVSEQKTRNPSFMTIGDFYSTIMDCFWDLADMQQILNKKDPQNKVCLFSGQPSKQFTYFNLEDMSEIYDLRSALNQIRLIIQEGEGANLFTLEGDINKQSHFFKFIEIYTQGQIQIPSSKEIVLTIIRENNSLPLKDSFPDNFLQVMADNWSNKDLIALKKERVNKEFCEEASTIAFPQGNQKPQYPDIYSVVGFTHAYEQILEELNLIFNTSFAGFLKIQKAEILKGKVDKYAQEKFNSSLKDTLNNPQLIRQKLQDKEAIKNASNDLVMEIAKCRTQFEVWRRKRMENAIAKMRQMTLHSDRVIHPINAVNPSEVKQNSIGMGPNYEVNFNQRKSFTCPSSKNRNK